jgi:hypothetical protein
MIAGGFSAGRFGGARRSPAHGGARQNDGSYHASEHPHEILIAEVEQLGGGGADPRERLASYPERCVAERFGSRAVLGKEVQRLLGRNRVPSSRPHCVRHREYGRCHLVDRAPQQVGLGGGTANEEVRPVRTQIQRAEGWVAHHDIGERRQRGGNRVDRNPVR